MGRAKAKQRIDSEGRVAELEGAMQRFSLTYGRDDQKLEKWQILCDDCGVEGGSSIRKCKAVGSDAPLNTLRIF